MPRYPRPGRLCVNFRLLAKAYEKPSPQLDYVRALIESQAGDEAGYLAVNLDAFGEMDANLAVDMMKHYVRRKFYQLSRGCQSALTAAMIHVLIAGLERMV